MMLNIGDTATLSKTITDDDIRAFANLSGDHNPVHLDDEYARTTRFKGRIAHGMLSASLISAVIGNHIPGRGAIYLNQTLRFLRPVFPGDTVTARITVTEIRADKPIATLETLCFNQNEELLIKGEAVVMFDPD